MYSNTEYDQDSLQDEKEFLDEQMIVIKYAYDYSSKSTTAAADGGVNKNDVDFFVN